MAAIQLPTSLTAAHMPGVPHQDQSPPTLKCLALSSLHPETPLPVAVTSIGRPIEADFRSMLEQAVLKDNPTSLRVLMAHPDFDMDYLIKQLPESAAQGKINIVRTILLKISEDPTLVRNPIDLLGTMLIKAAKAGQLEIVQAMMSTEAFRDIPTNYLSLAVFQAKGYRDVIEALIKSERPHEIRVIGDRGILIQILLDASRKGQLGVVQAIMGFGLFREIAPENLGRALMYAIEAGHLKIAQAIMDSGRFHEISTQNLGEALIGAVMGGQFETVQTIIGCSRFDIIRPVDLGKARRMAIDANRLDIVQLINHRVQDA